MPIVRIDMMEGRSKEKIEGMIGAVSSAIAESLDASIESVRVVVNEMEPHEYGVGGRPWSVVAAERAAAQEGGA